MPGRKKNKLDDLQIGAQEIEKYLQKRDIPEWFRGISKFQCDAASGLSEALLYDGEQRSTHRVKACVTSLGLRPPVSKEQLKMLMKISRGNDLAFLWFLLESYYKTKGPAYSINEQIIYSCIAHLDMVTTLRELDRLLPSNPSQEIKVPKKLKRPIVVKATKFKQFRLNRLTYSPYLEDIKAPIVEHPPLHSKRPDLKISLDEYEIYKDPTYIVRNESNRWFATYTPKSSKRIVGRILREEIEKILDNGDEIAKEVENKLVVCQYHRRLIEAEIKRKCDLVKKKRSDIKKYFDIDGVKKRRTREEILAQIERDVEMFRQKFRYDAERQRMDSNRANQKQKIEVLEGIDSIRYYAPNNTEAGDHCKETEKEMSSTEEDGNEEEELGKQREFGEHLKNDQFFFIANHEHQPWYFDYKKIFNIDQSYLTTEQRVKLSFVKALNSETSLSPDINGNVNMEKAFNRGFKKQWSESVKIYNRIAVPPIKIDDGDVVPIHFDRDHFDPNDKPYMVYMLKCCFDRMKKDPKFVLASLPDAHKIPSLLYFMQDRYGKRYSFEERQSLFAQSLRILRALEKLTRVAPTPKLADFSSDPNVSYACRDYLLAKGEKVRQNYYEELDQIIMHKARIFWFSMRPYLFTSGPPRNTYFAYMPGRTVDLTRFRQWKPSEFMDAKKEWDRRQREAKKRR